MEEIGLATSNPVIRYEENFEQPVRYQCQYMTETASINSSFLKKKCVIVRIIIMITSRYGNELHTIRPLWDEMVVNMIFSQL